MCALQLSLFDNLYETSERNPEDEMIVKALEMGSGIEQGKTRIYEFALTNPSIEKLSKFLIDEYGVGGRATPYRNPYTIHQEHHDGKGIRFKWIDGDGQDNETIINWSKAAGIILSLVKQGRYG